MAVVALAAMLQDSNLFPMEAFAKAIGMFQGAKIADVNLKALAAGAALVPVDQ